MLETRISTVVVELAATFQGVENPIPGIVTVPCAPRDGDAAVMNSVNLISAGSMFGLFFVAFSYPGEDAGFFPAVAARVASVTLLGLTTAVTVARGVDRA